MATTFTSGTFSGLANAAAVGQSVAERLRDDLVAHAAWELVEEVTPGTMHWYVLRCLSAVSGLPSNFYLVMGRVISTGVLHWFICEGYNDTTNVASLFGTNSGAGSGSTTYTYDSSGRQTTNTFTLSTSAPSSSNGQPRSHTWTPSGTGTNWWILAREDSFTLNIDGASDAFVHIGAFEWMAAVANTMPILSNGTNTVTGQNGFLTRNPACVSGSFGHRALTLHPEPGLLTNSDMPYKLLGYNNRLDRTVDAMNGGVVPCSEIAVVIDIQPTVNAVNEANVIGEFLGKYKHMRFARGPISAAWGDAYEMDGTLWVPTLYGTTNAGAGLLHDTLVAA